VHKCALAARRSSGAQGLAFSGFTYTSSLYLHFACRVPFFLHVRDSSSLSMLILSAQLSWQVEQGYVFFSLFDLSI
jgi:hypothetical protein